MTDLIIIGSGISGMSAALYALRSGKSVLILEKENVGGQISFSPKVENFPSVLSISGADLSEKIFEQVTNLGAQFELEDVSKIEKEGNVFTVTTDYSEHKSKAVIIASGVKNRRTGIDGETELIGKGVSYCALCDGAFYAGEEVALIGDANTAVQYVLHLSNYCKKVSVFTLFDKFFAEDYLIKALRAKSNVEVTHEVSLSAFETHEDELSGLTFKKKDGSIFTHDTKAVFIAIGQVPDNEKYASLVELDKSGYIVAGETCETKTPGLYVAGDCRTKKIRQLVTASADGAVAATLACTYIDCLK